MTIPIASATIFPPASLRSDLIGIRRNADRVPSGALIDFTRIRTGEVHYGKMKAISIRPPWAWAILHAGKDIENRTWKTKMRGTIAVHASQTMNRPYYEAAVKEIKRIAPAVRVPSYDTMVRGAIVGLVDVVGCEEQTKSSWHVRDHYGFVLVNPRALRKPIPCNGRLSFWDVPDALARLIMEELK